MNNKHKSKIKVRATSVCLLLFLLALAVRAQGEVLVHSGQKIAFLGDSITAYGWGYAGGYVHLVVDGLSKEGVRVTPIPAGVGGNTSKDMLARLETDVLSKKPDWMTLSCGVNDVWHGVNGVDLNTYKTNIIAIVDQAQANGIKILILTATVIGEEPNANNAKLEAYNDFLRALAKERNLPLADLNATFHKTLDPLAPNKQSRYLTLDGVHMNPDGNVLMAKGILEAFGVAPVETQKIEQAWFGQENTAAIGNYPYDFRPNLSVTLGQYRAIVKAAERNRVDPIKMGINLWLRAMAEAVDNQRQDGVIDWEKIKKEAQNILVSEIKKLDSPQ